jgi:phage tail sheath protein FI
MLPVFNYSGVYVEELPIAVHRIAGVATSIPAFVGWAPQGPVNQATLWKVGRTFRRSLADGILTVIWVTLCTNSFQMEGSRHTSSGPEYPWGQRPTSLHF